MAAFICKIKLNYVKLHISVTIFLADHLKAFDLFRLVTASFSDV